MKCEEQRGSFDPGMSRVAISGVVCSKEPGVRFAAAALIGLLMSSLAHCLENSGGSAKGVWPVTSHTSLVGSEKQSAIIDHLAAWMSLLALVLGCVCVCVVHR